MRLQISRMDFARLWRFPMASEVERSFENWREQSAVGLDEYGICPICKSMNTEICDCEAERSFDHDMPLSE